jgi:hypothetical protein
MFRRLLGMGVTLMCVSLFCVLITQAYPAEFYASLMALFVSAFMVVLALVSPWALRRFFHVEWAGHGPATQLVRTDRPDPRRPRSLSRPEDRRPLR